MEIIKKISKFFKNIWGKIKPSIKKQISFFATLLLLSSIFISFVSLGLLLEVFLFGGLTGLFTVSFGIYGIYFCVKNFSIFRRSFSFDNELNAVLENKLLDKLEKETYLFELFTKKELEFLEQCLDKPESTFLAQQFKEENGELYKFIEDNLICSFTMEIINNPITVYIKDRQNNKITNTYERKSLLDWLNGNNLRDPLSGVEYAEAKKIKFKNGFSAKEGDTFKKNITLIKQRIAECLDADRKPPKKRTCFSNILHSFNLFKQKNKQQPEQKKLIREGHHVNLRP